MSISVCYIPGMLIMLCIMLHLFNMYVLYVTAIALSIVQPPVICLHVYVGEFSSALNFMIIRYIATIVFLCYC